MSAPLKAATITITIDDSIYQRVLDGFALQNGYPPKVPENGKSNGPLIDNPEKKEVFMNRLVSEYILISMASSESKQAALAASNTALNDIKANISPLISVSSQSTLPK